MATPPRTLIDGLGLPEAPRPAPGGGIVFSDVWANAVMSLDLATGVHRVLGTVPGRPNGLGWLPNGRLVAVSMQTKRLYVLEDRGFVPSVDLSAVAGDLLNELVIDEHGRAYVSDHVLASGVTAAERHADARPAGLFLVDFTDPSPRPRRVADGLFGPNGMVILPDGRTLVVAETGRERLTAFTIDDDGSLGSRRVWATLNFAPDGLALDASGLIWVASSYPEGYFVRVAEGGEIDHRIMLEGDGGFACLVQDGQLLLLEAPLPAHPDDRRGRIRILAEPV